MGNFKRIAFIGTHGSGKGYLTENAAEFGVVDPDLNPSVMTYVTAFWTAIKEPKLREIQLSDRFLYQFSLIGSAVTQYLENERGLFERSPLDIVAYCHLLEDDLKKAYKEGSIDESYYGFCMNQNLLQKAYDKLFTFCEENVDVLVYVPFNEKIIDMRGEQTDYRELKKNSRVTDGYMRQVLSAYFENNESGTENPSKRKTKFICLNAEPEERFEALKTSLDNLNNVQYVFNGYNPLV